MRDGFRRGSRAALLRFGPSSRSLARLAAQELRRARGATGARGIIDTVRRRVDSLAQSRWVLLYWTGIALVPIEVGPRPELARFISASWEVVTGTIAISLALQVFALERFAGSREARYGEPVLDFARKTHLLGVFYAGFGAILVNGLALLQVGPARAR